MHLFALAGLSLWPSWIPYALVKALTTDSAAAELAAALAAAAADMMMSMTKFGSSSVPVSGATGGAELPLPLEAFCGSSLKRGGRIGRIGRIGRLVVSSSFKIPYLTPDVLDLLLVDLPAPIGDLYVDSLLVDLPAVAPFPMFDNIWKNHPSSGAQMFSVEN